MEQDSKVSRGSAGERTCAEHPCPRRMEVCGAVAVCVALCLFSLGVCVLVYLRTSELHTRVNSMEKNREPQYSAWMFLEQVEPVLLKRLDQMMEEVSGSHQDMKVYKHEEPSRCYRCLVLILSSRASYRRVKIMKIYFSLEWNVCAINRN